MKLYEYQAKKVFKDYGINIPKSVIIEKSEALEEALSIVGTPCVVKSQVLSGGRGKAGLVKFTKTKSEAKAETKRLFEHELNIKKLLIEEAIDIQKEIYVSITVDPYLATGLLIVSAEGGIDIETLAVTQPEKIIKEPIDLRYGLMPFQASQVAYALGLPKEVTKELKKLFIKLYNAFVKYDAELIEINPLFITKDNQVVAGDGKLMIDDNSMFRHPDLEKNQADYKSEAEFDAAEEGIPFIQFDGNIGLMCAGAGLTTTVYDLIHYEGGTIANYLEFGGPHYKKAVKAMEICLKVPSKVILIVTFGTIARADVMAEGIVDAITRLKPDRPIVTCIRGTNEAEAVKILKAAGLEPLFDTEEAVRKAVQIAKGGSK
ncbi:succinate--CoA ligase subunit beta [Candidatus Izemoplasma sp. B36]|uniref:succinate--CoA ligase subunit beta n=1 Tax=Candidatus Izemoplasma sp. B36 TaxID=3242468 RepID=UPI003556516F